MARLARIIVLLVLAAALGGCSAIKLGYNNLDQVAYWWLDSYVDFADDQSMRVREDLGRLQAWHRVQELPRLIALLQEVESLAPGEVSAQQVCAFVPKLRERVNAVTDRAEPAVVTLALGLAPEQLAHLERKYTDNNQRFTKEWVRLDRAELIDKRFKQFVERSEMFYGNLEEPQRAALRQQLDRSIFDPRRLLAERQRRQQDALQTLRRLAGQPVALAEARALVRGYLHRVQASPDAGYRRYEQDLIAEGCRNIAFLHNQATAVQRQAAAQRLRAYQRDLSELAAQ